MRSGRNRHVFTGILLLLAAGVAHAERGSITADALAERMEAGDEVVVLDVRTVQEYSEGHIPGAVNIPHSKLESRVGEIAEYREVDIVVHCRTGRRAKFAEGVLEEEGFTNVIDLDGHWLGWRAAGHPMQKGAAASKKSADQSAGGAQDGGSK